MNQTLVNADVLIGWDEDDGIPEGWGCPPLRDVFEVRALRYALLCDRDGRATVHVGADFYASCRPSMPVRPTKT
jgi:hypothetical protein